MIRKYILIALVILPAIVFSQDNRTIVISPGNYGFNSRTKSFCEVFNHVASLNFVKKIFHVPGNFLHQLRDRIPFTKSRRSDFVYSYPGIFSFDEHKIILPNRNIILLPDRRIYMNENRNTIIIKKNGRTIYINRGGS